MAAIAFAVARVSQCSVKKIRFWLVLSLIGLFIGSNVSVNVPSSSIEHVDRALIANGGILARFLVFEVRKCRQLLRRAWKTTTDKFFRSQSRSLSTLKWYSKAVSFCKKCSFIVCNVYALVVLQLLVRSGIEPNPGPVPAPAQAPAFNPALGPIRAGVCESFKIISQNCRGLTDRKKLMQVLRKMFPVKNKLASRSVACLQESHKIDRFTIRNYFKGKAVIDDGERNQRGVCILIPENFEVCSSSISGLGRWAIAVIKDRHANLSQKLVVANVYGPNCHREAIAFYQEFFHSFDEIIEDLVS